MITRSSALILLVASLLVTGCPKKSDEPAAKKPAVTRPAKKPAAKPPTAKKKPAAKKPAKEERLSEEQRQAYLAALAKGRKLARKKKWADAVKAFSAALKILPMDGRALSEQGWAAYQIGDYKLARAANARSVLAATKPEVKAASLYNLGRTAEAMGQWEEAARYYRRSLKLRPHAAVEKRLTGLGKQAPKRSVAPEVDDPCKPKRPSTLAAICACLIKENTFGAPVDKPTCGLYDKLKTHSEALKTIKVLVPSPHTETYYLLARQPGKASKPLYTMAAQIGYVYNPGAFGINESFAFAPTKVEKLGARRLLKIVSTKRRHDTDMGVDEVSTRKVVTLTACLLPDKPETSARCVLQIALEDRYARDVLGLAKGKNAHHSRLPIKSHSKVDVRIAANGQATVKLVDGVKDKALASKLGTHKLW